MVMGDAAFQTKPFSGEGVTSSFTACQIAAEVAAQALGRGDVSRESLWDYNVRYFRGLDVSSTATKIKALYQRFPDDPAQFQAWVVEAKPLWEEA